MSEDAKYNYDILGLFFMCKEGSECGCYCHTVGAVSCVYCIDGKAEVIK